MKTILGILCLLLISCNDSNLYRQDIDKIKIGQKKSQVLKTLGNPRYADVDQDGDYKLVYHFTDSVITFRKNTFSVLFYFKNDTLNHKTFR